MLAKLALTVLLALTMQIVTTRPVHGAIGASLASVHLNAPIGQQATFLVAILPIERRPRKGKRK